MKVMVFSSLLFLFIFLTLNLAIYYGVREKKSQNKVMIVFSLIFYAWGGPRYLFLLVGDTLVSWACALKIEKERAEGKPEKSAKKYLFIECALLLGVLGVFKYMGFILGNISWLISIPFPVPDIALPIGISFYTFQLISYVADVYWGKTQAQPKFWKLLLYSSLFHQCVAGPIVRYEAIAGEIDQREVTFNDLYEGVRQFSVGLAKKAILANSCGAASDSLLPQGAGNLAMQSTAGLWLGMLFYMLQIYLDFSAYSDMAIGMGRMTGFHYNKNFDYPYMACSVKDFWRRWHISLSTFFRDYVYIPLGGSRCGTIKYIRNMAVVWFLTGLWHGANWNYIFWGLWYLFFLLLERFVIKDRLPRVISHIFTLLVVLFGWVIFKFEDLAELSVVWKGMFGIGTPDFVNINVTTVFQQHLFFLAFSVIAVTSFGKKFRKLLLAGGRYKKGLFAAINVMDMVTPALLLVLSVFALVGANYNPFLYFRF